MTREQFQQTVRSMQEQGVPLTMANLMVRTELPRAQIERWLDDMQRDVRLGPMKPSKSSATSASSSSSSSSSREAAGDAGEKSGPQGLLARARALKNEVLSEASRKAIKDRLGIADANAKKIVKRPVRRGALIGVAMPPAGLFYSAPWVVAGVGTGVYLAVLFLVWLLPMLAIPYLLIPAHLAGGVLGGAYAWRYNRKGERAALLPGGGKAKKRDRDRDRK